MPSPEFANEATVRVRPMTEADWPSCALIYQAGIDTGNATFDPSPSDWATFDDRTVSSCNLVAVVDDESSGSDKIVGCTWGLPVSQREVLRGVIEESVYVHPDYSRLGIGRLLLRELIANTEADGIWTLQAGIFPENEASLLLHEALGFRTVGIRERYALMEFGPYEGQWRDVVLLERRRAD